jgi:hypothetical protein
MYLRDKNLETFLSTFTTIAVTILAFVGTFYGAYLVYLREQRDRYREKLIKDFQKLDSLISHFSILEDLTLPPSWSWSPPTGKLYEILEPESWKQTPMEILEEPVKRLEEEYRKAREEEAKLMSKVEGRIPARAALYLKVKFALNEIISLLYREFPPPPGDYKVSPPPGRIPFAVKSYIRSDFPSNRGEFLKWTERYDLYYSGVVNLYYRIRPIISTLKKVSIEASESLQQLMAMLNETSRLTQWQEESLTEIQELYIRESSYYESIFQYLRDIKRSVDRIRDRITTYDRYRSKFKVQILISLVVMSILGIVIPLIMLSPFKSEQILMYYYELSLIVLLLFSLVTILTIIFIYRDITAS